MNQRHEMILSAIRTGMLARFGPVTHARRVEELEHWTRLLLKELSHHYVLPEASEMPPDETEQP